ncbi:hypothetical protein CVAR_2308 [Corynebacterium variabile DSM 44702]|uniref:Uncharacterized protein n=1 Tax=Corynebacterium variabile (strain DSM 44702 / CIP 107183 / JCM 12073 / NCIMB 30131) TaxID=858619 RepID=G0HGP6_CORVD|nr:hypothetical protein [Corynebacterium variabile]AEK37653.1 hypothetical protein CVAR_2308 [Corynebacterium variabile DSM 44702]
MTATPGPFGRPDERTGALLAARRAVEDADSLDAVVAYGRGLLGTLAIAFSEVERTADPVELQNVLHDVEAAAGEVSRELSKALGW